MLYARIAFKNIIMEVLDGTNNELEKTTPGIVDSPGDRALQVLIAPAVDLYSVKQKARKPQLLQGSLMFPVAKRDGLMVEPHVNCPSEHEWGSDVVPMLRSHSIASISGGPYWSEP
jgi:hypothetical protein